MEPTILTLFGISGDLAGKMILPSLYHLERHGLLSKGFRLVGVARTDLTGRKLKEHFRRVVKKSEGSGLDSKVLARLAEKSSFVQGSVEEENTYRDLEASLKAIEKKGKFCANRLFYFSTYPSLYLQIAKHLKKSNLLSACTADDRQMRILIEKPFGSNLPTAKALNHELLKYFTESQIYRIDHYLGKETVQNLMVVRFANALFEPLWNSRYIDHIQISVLEDDLVGSRAKFYDETGALRDIVQNHLLQMLALVAMDEPRELKEELIRDEKVKILKALAPYSASDARTCLVRGQYSGYSKEVGHKSNTETYIALKTEIDTPRWRGVPIYLRTGKALQRKVTEISIQFKELPKCLFRYCAANVLTFRIQPDESVFLRINNKIPGFGIDLHQGDLEFSYHRNYQREVPSAYERLLLDFFQGDQRLFTRSDEIEASWMLIDSIRKHWNGKAVALQSYKKGTAGPKQADKLIEADGRKWLTN